MLIEPGGFYETRNGAQVFITKAFGIPFRVGNEAREWVGWTGIFLTTGQSSSWEIDGMYSPMSTGPNDLVNPC